MKTLLKSVYTLAALGVCPMATAQEPPAEAPAGSNHSITQINLIPMLHMPSYAFYGDEELTINFPAAMVAEVSRMVEVTPLIWVDSISI